MAALPGVDWIIALLTIAFCASSFGNGANDVANSYATSVAARTLTLVQVGVLAAITEFIGAVALGARVTGTIKNDVIDLGRFVDNPRVLVLAMGCAEFASAFWLLLATRLGFPVSTTQTIVGALVGVGIAAQSQVSWAWDSGSVSQVAASWGIAPAIAACFAAILFMTIKFSILERKDPLKKAMRAIPIYLAFTAAVLAMFFVVELAPGGADIDDMPPGEPVGIVLGVFFGVLAISYIFFMPYFHRRLIQSDARVRAWHIPLGPLLYRENPPLYFPGDANGEPVVNYYESNSANVVSGGHSAPQENIDEKRTDNFTDETMRTDQSSSERDIENSAGQEANPPNKKIEPEDRFLAPNRHLPVFHPQRLWGFVKYVLLQGVTRDCVTYDSEHMKKTHELAVVYENRVEHLWTYCQVASAIIMSISHGSNDVANAVGPWVAAYNTWQDGFVDEEGETGTPVWILVVAGILLGAGFWFFGWRIIRALGNRITRVSPTRGYSIELGAAITVLLASRLGLPVSTTQCLTGATLGVALCNFQLGAVNWRQLVFILFGWLLTLPCAGLIAGLLFAMANNSPGF
ncbi:hypothetical protein MBLNU230_g4623t1 [Neophaeotheca triangularis]